MSYVKVNRDSLCDDCGKPLYPLSHFRICPKCRHLSCCTSSSHHAVGGCYEAWLLAKTDVMGPFVR